MTTDSFHGYQEHPQPYSTMNLLLSSGATTIVQLPLAFVRSGDVSLSNGSIYVVGNGGYYWAHTVYSTTSARYLSFDTSSVGPSNANSRSYGFSLRCHTSFSSIRHYLGRGSGGGNRHNDPNYLTEGCP